jgi:hypothetical protein
MSPDAPDIKTVQSRRRFYVDSSAATSAAVGIEGAAPIRCTQIDAAALA